jgi:hypothetical protein
MCQVKYRLRLEAYSGVGTGILDNRDETSRDANSTAIFIPWGFGELRISNLLFLGDLGI